MRKQRGNVFAAIAQRRQLKVNDVEAVIEIFSEAAFADKGEEVHVGGGDDADVDFNLLSAAEAHEFALLNDAEKLGLRFRTDGGDFVEEDRALIGDFEKAFFGSHGAGERTLDVTEKLRLEEIDRDGAGVNGDERFVRTGRGGVDGLGDEFLPSATLPADEHGGARGRDLGDELVVGPRLGDVIHGAAFEGGTSHIDGAVSGDEHNGKMGIAAADFLQQIQAVAVGKADVQQQ